MKNIYILIFSLLFLSNANAQSDFFHDDWQPKMFVHPGSSMEYTGSSTGGLADITINVDDTLNKILPTIIGNNLPAWRSSLLNNTTITEHIERLNIKTIRIPGGNWSNLWLWDGINHWDGSNQDGYSGTLKAYNDTENYIDEVKSEPTTSWNLSTDELLQICDEWNAQPQICVNYSLARYIDAANPVQQAAHYAAEWVRYVKSKGIDVKYWEIGNEHYGSWEAGYIVEGDTITGAEYGRDACVFIDSMKQADPDIKIGIVVYPAADYRTMPNYTPEVLQEAGDKADFLICHEYFTWASDPNDVEYSEILNAIPTIKTDYDTIQAMVKLYTSKDYMPVAMTEYNYVAGLKQTEGVSALFFAHALGEYMTNNYGLVNFWDIQNGNGEEDHGMFTLGETDVDDDTPHPSFFPYFLYNKMFGDVLVETTCNDDDIYVYASRFSNDYAAIAIINETASDKDVSISIPYYDLNDTAFRYELSIDDLSSRKIYINDITSPDGELYASQDYYNIAPYRHLLTDNKIETGIKKYSVNYFVVE
ncbi:MAG: hypothetical protein GXO47_03030, partial [Chlorobi bacterium]|nr:hypothetical protein [Chlorobiota bacterium]